MNKPAGGFEYRVVHQSKIELVVRTTPDSGCIVALQRTGAPGHKQPPALKKRLQEVGPPARCNPFPCDPDRDTLPA